MRVDCFVDKIERFGDDGIEENTDDIGVVEVDIYSDDQEEVRHQVDDENLKMKKFMRHENIKTTGREKKFSMSQYSVSKRCQCHPDHDLRIMELVKVSISQYSHYGS